MSQDTTQPVTSLPRGALRIVLFGMPDAGKTSLLGALAQAAETQEHSLKGHLVDPTQGLAKLRHLLYDEQPARTSEEVTPYPIALEPFPAIAEAGKPGPVQAVLIDCDGKVANEFLGRQRSLNGSPEAGPLGEAILGADTLVLAVDASANPEVLKRDFAQYAKFLRLLEQSRSQRTEVGGLPVYLVLTKCDLLAKPGDSLITWLERIEEHKRVVDRKFQEYLAQSAARETQPFGKIALNLWATAVKKPELQNSPAKPREPYGVAELFRQCLQSAAEYRTRRAQAGRRLHWVVGGLAAFAGLLLLLGFFFWVTQPPAATNALEQEINNFRSEIGTERLREPVDGRIWQLEKFLSDPEFKQIRPELRQYIEESLFELHAYQNYRKALDGLQAPRFVRSEAELTKLTDGLEKLPPPPLYANAWAETRAVKQRERWLHEVEVLRKEVNRAVKAYRDLVARWNQIQTEPLTATKRRAKEKELLNQADNLPYREENRDRLLPGSNSLTYDNVLQMERVADAYREWRAIRQEQKQ
jgi:GTPase SAR1 family protein